MGRFLLVIQTRNHEGISMEYLLLFSSQLLSHYNLCNKGNIALIAKALQQGSSMQTGV